MIDKLQIINFKCFKELQLKLRKITLLTGINGMGKSSIIQTLLLLRQSFIQLWEDKGLDLNGDLVKIGTARDALFEEATDEDIAFEISEIPGNYGGWAFDCSIREANFLNQTFGEVRGTIFQNSLFRDNFHYLSAERIGPRTSYEMNDNLVRVHRQIGPQGEYASHFLYLFGDESIPIETLAHPEEKTLKLRTQVEAWMNDICPGVRIHIQSHSLSGMDLVNLRYSFASKGRVVSSEYRSTNVGFGVTYTLPILVAILSSAPGSLVILENPESHLHPAGQVLLGKLMTMAAANGVQIIVESHSDHILNGIRVSVKEEVIPPEQVKIHFFEKPQEGEVSPNVISPRIDKRGRIDQWPDGFFDEWDKSLEDLI